jgi:hypothetical protein
LLVFKAQQELALKACKVLLVLMEHKVFKELLALVHKAQLELALRAHKGIREFKAQLVLVLRVLLVLKAQLDLMECKARRVTKA